jgi:hypothetical protein
LIRGHRKNSTNMIQAIENTLQNGTIVRKEVVAHWLTGSQVKCTAIDSINREKVQHVICSSAERPGVNRVMSFLQCLAPSATHVPPDLSVVTQEGVNHSNSNEGIAEDVARYCSKEETLV